VFVSLHQRTRKKDKTAENMKKNKQKSQKRKESAKSNEIV